jgi:aminobenzoyl-glutamate utilization protein B
MTKRLALVFSTIALFCLLIVVAPSAQQIPSADDLKKEAIAQVDGLQTLTQQMVDEIFSYSELGFQEFETSRYVTGILEKNGFRVERGVAGIPTAWTATFGSGRPVIGFITDIDCIPQASQKPGVAYHDPIIAGAPGHGEGHNSGQAVNVTAAIVLKNLMEKYHLPGTLKLFPGVAEELVGTKAYYIQAGLFRDVDMVLGVHVSSEFTTAYGPSGSGLVSVQYSFHGKAAHAAADPWDGHSALAAVELMDVGWDFRREYLRIQQRSHHVIFNGGDQPNVVPPEAGDWYYFRELDYPHIKELYALGNKMAEAASMMTDTTWEKRLVGSAWPGYFNKVIAEDQIKNIKAVGMPVWSDDDQTLARAMQKEVGKPVIGLSKEISDLREPHPELATGGASDDVGDISWNVPMVYMRYPANIPGMAGHSWESGVAMATPIAHKGSSAGAKVQAMTAIDFLTNPALIQQAWDFFNNVQTKDTKYVSFIQPGDKPAIEMNKDKMAPYLTELRKNYYDPKKYKSYLEQLGIKYPTVKKQ